ncbi:hypothetical protein HDU96_009207 [Phlyctochytrium bullatum]|nr:hypothetical protein HDU96_009207 [Phlyctochytrium bullatum]
MNGHDGDLLSAASSPIPIKQSDTLTLSPEQRKDYTTAASGADAPKLSSVLSSPERSLRDAVATSPVLANVGSGSHSSGLPVLHSTSPMASSPKRTVRRMSRDHHHQNYPFEAMSPFSSPSSSVSGTHNLHSHPLMGHRQAAHSGYLRHKASFHSDDMDTPEAFEPAINSQGDLREAGQLPSAFRSPENSGQHLFSQRGLGAAFWKRIVVHQKPVPNFAHAASEESTSPEASEGDLLASYQRLINKDPEGAVRLLIAMISERDDCLKMASEYGLELLHAYHVVEAERDLFKNQFETASATIVDQGLLIAEKEVEVASLTMRCNRLAEQLRSTEIRMIEITRMPIEMPKENPEADAKESSPANETAQTQKLQRVDKSLAFERRRRIDRVGGRAPDSEALRSTIPLARYSETQLAVDLTYAQLETVKPTVEPVVRVSSDKAIVRTSSHVSVSSLKTTSLSDATGENFDDDTNTSARNSISEPPNTLSTADDGINKPASSAEKPLAPLPPQSSKVPLNRTASETNLGLYESQFKGSQLTASKLNHRQSSPALVASDVRSRTSNLRRTATPWLHDAHAYGDDPSPDAEAKIKALKESEHHLRKRMKRLSARVMELENMLEESRREAAVSEALLASQASSRPSSVPLLKEVTDDGEKAAEDPKRRHKATVTGKSGGREQMKDGKGKSDSEGEETWLGLVKELTFANRKLEEELAETRTRLEVSQAEAAQLGSALEEAQNELLLLGGIPAAYSRADDGNKIPGLDSLGPSPARSPGTSTPSSPLSDHAGPKIPQGFTTLHEDIYKTAAETGNKKIVKKLSSRRSMGSLFGSSPKDDKELPIGLGLSMPVSQAQKEETSAPPKHVKGEKEEGGFGVSGEQITVVKDSGDLPKSESAPLTGAKTTPPKRKKPERKDSYLLPSSTQIYLRTLHTIALSIHSRLGTADTVKMNRRLRRAFDLAELTKLSQSVITNISSDIQTLTSRFPPPQPRTTGKTDPTAPQPNDSDDAGSIVFPIVTLVQGLLADIAILRSTLNDLTLAYYERLAQKANEEKEAVVARVSHSPAGKQASATIGTAAGDALRSMQPSSSLFSFATPHRKLAMDAVKNAHFGNGTWGNDERSLSGEASISADGRTAMATTSTWSRVKFGSLGALYKSRSAGDLLGTGPAGNGSGSEDGGDGTAAEPAKSAGGLSAVGWPTWPGWAWTSVKREGQDEASQSENAMPAASGTENSQQPLASQSASDTALSAAKLSLSPRDGSFAFWGLHVDNLFGHHHHSTDSNAGDSQAANLPRKPTISLPNLFAALTPPLPHAKPDNPTGNEERDPPPQHAPHTPAPLSHHLSAKKSAAVGTSVVTVSATPLARTRLSFGRAVGAVASGALAGPTAAHPEPALDSSSGGEMYLPPRLPSSVRHARPALHKIVWKQQQQQQQEPASSAPSASEVLTHGPNDTNAVTPEGPSIAPQITVAAVSPRRISSESSGSVGTAVYPITAIAAVPPLPPALSRIGRSVSAFENLQRVPGSSTTGPPVAASPPTAMHHPAALRGTWASGGTVQPGDVWKWLAGYGGSADPAWRRMDTTRAIRREVVIVDEPLDGDGDGGEVERKRLSALSTSTVLLADEEAEQCDAGETDEARAD